MIVLKRKPSAAILAGCRHAEAFCLMLYRDTAGNEEWIWNSRDGVTPFITRSRAGLQAQHVDWHRDQFRPDYTPALGERIFVDLTWEDALEYADRVIEQYWPMCKVFESRDEAHEALARDAYGDGHRPKLIEVTPEVLDRLKERHQ